MANCADVHEPHMLEPAGFMSMSLSVLCQDVHYIPMALEMQIDLWQVGPKAVHTHLC